MHEMCVRIAARMYGGDPDRLDPTLVTELNEINLLCNMADGEIRSRQIVALIIRQWMKENPTKNPYRG